MSLPDRLLVVTDRHGSHRPLADTVRAVCAAGARWVWLRDRDLAAPARHDLALALLAIVRAAGGRLTIGGDAALATAIGADGVHLGGSDEPIAARVAAARGVLGPEKRVGVSAHGLADLRAAAQAGADYATLSPIFETASKPGYGPALGLDGLRAAAAYGLPVIALGGIGPDEARACRQAGAAGVAVMGGLMRAPDPAERTRALLAAVG